MTHRKYIIALVLGIALMAVGAFLAVKRGAG